ncbi:MAG: histidine kinase [Spirulina sp. SIO3F2]|nr:histidine kinase [Spirulina sp. SIO3F2]
MSDSLLKDVLQNLSFLRSQVYFKSSLVALSHALEDLVLAGEDVPLVIANFQRERFYRQEIRRYRQIAQRTDQVYILAAPEQESGFVVDADPYEAIPLHPNDALTQEWHLVIVGQQYSACLVCREQSASTKATDQMRRFEGIWTFDQQASLHAARWLLGRITAYRPELTEKVEQAWQQYGLMLELPRQALIPVHQGTDTSIFGQRLVTYLQAGQYRLLKAYGDLETLNHRLEAIEQTQRNLIAIVGHELRTPLSTIQVCLETIATEPDMPTDFFNVMLDTALTDTERMRKLIQNCLILSRLETGKEPLCLDSIQIQEIIALVLNNLKVSWTRTPLPTIHLDLPSDLPIICADGEGLFKVLTELLENACKFTEPEGEITVQAQIYAIESETCDRVPENNTAVSPMLEVIVADSGRGIEASQLDAIFNWFSQEEDYLRRTVGGVGLGLAICRQLIQGMGGQIWADSVGKNQGSRFHFTVPIELSIDSAP